MFVEINEVGRYSNKTNSEGEYIFKQFIKGKIIINTDQIRCISVYDFNWKDKENYIVDYDSIKYCVYFDKDRYVYTDIESYEKIKKLIITCKEPLYEKV